jgi:hypothetical protein
MELRSSCKEKSSDENWENDNSDVFKKVWDMQIRR